MHNTLNIVYILRYERFEKSKFYFLIFAAAQSYLFYLITHMFPIVETKYIYFKYKNYSRQLTSRSYNFENQESFVYCRIIRDSFSIFVGYVVLHNHYTMVQEHHSFFENVLPLFLCLHRDRDRRKHLPRLFGPH